MKILRAIERVLVYTEGSGGEEVIERCTRVSDRQRPWCALPEEENRSTRIRSQSRTFFNAVRLGDALTDSTLSSHSVLDALRGRDTGRRRGSTERDRGVVTLFVRSRTDQVDHVVAEQGKKG